MSAGSDGREKKMIPMIPCGPPHRSIVIFFIFVRATGDERSNAVYSIFFF